MSEIQRRGSGSAKWDLAAVDEIPLWVADMDFAVAPPIVAAIEARLGHPVFGYGLVPASLGAAVCEWHAARSSWPIDPESLLVVPSVMNALAIGIETLTSPGARVATASPVYPPFFRVIERLGRRVVRVPLATEEADGGPRLRFNLASLEEACRSSDLFLLCSPHNPGGRAWTREELNAVAAICARCGTTVISDEIHADLLFPGERFVPWTTVEPQLPGFAVIAPSKTFNIPGLPLAFAVIPDPVLRRRIHAALEAHKLNHHNLLALAAAEAGYRAGGAWLDKTRRTIADHYRLLVDRVTGWTGARAYAMEGTFIAWVDLGSRLGLAPHLADGRDPIDGAGAPVPMMLDPGDPGERDTPTEAFGRHARRHGVWVSHGTQFGPEGAGHVRINVATGRQTLINGLDRLERALETFHPGAGSPTR